MYDYEILYDLEMQNNRLFATFTQQDSLDELIFNISNSYNIIYNKIFILFVKSTNEYVLTYNVEQGNIDSIPQNTILVHRKKDFNVLYSINALNELIKSLNNGKIDSSFPIDWKKYKNSILLTQHGEFKTLETKIFKIIEV